MSNHCTTRHCRISCIRLIIIFLRVQVGGYHPVFVCCELVSLHPAIWGSKKLKLETGRPWISSYFIKTVCHSGWGNNASLHVARLSEWFQTELMRHWLHETRPHKTQSQMSLVEMLVTNKGTIFAWGGRNFLLCREKEGSDDFVACGWWVRGEKVPIIKRCNQSHCSLFLCSSFCYAPSRVLTCPAAIWLAGVTNRLVVHSHTTWAMQNMLEMVGCGCPACIWGTGTYCPTVWTEMLSHLCLGRLNRVWYHVVCTWPKVRCRLGTQSCSVWL